MSPIQGMHNAVLCVVRMGARYTVKARPRKLLICTGPVIGPPYKIWFFVSCVLILSIRLRC